MSDTRKILDALAAKVADMQKAVEANKGANADLSKNEAIRKQIDDLVKTKVETERKLMLAEIRKGSYVPPKSERVSHEILIEKADNPRTLAFQRWNDDVYLLSSILKQHPSTLRIWEKFAPAFSELRKAMDAATAAEGLEWIPTDFSMDLIDRVRLARKIAALFPEIRMPTDPYKLPGVKTDARAYLVSEQTADGPHSTSTFTASTPATRNVTLDAVKLGARIDFSTELVEDSIIPVLDFVKNQLAIALAEALEDALINGDTTSPHMDADVTASADARKAWKGLRKLAQDANQVSLSTFSLANLRAMRAKMGKYGTDPSKLVYICSAKGYIKFLGVDEVITMEKYGPNATVLTGELGKIDGVSIIVSELVRDDLNAVGVNDATTNSKGEVLLAYVPGFIMGEKRKVTVKSFEDVQNDKTAIVASWRGDFKSLYDETTEPLVIEGVNLAV